MKGGENRATEASRLVASALLALLALDLVLIVVTGGVSILPSPAPTSPQAFAAREVLVALALVARLRLLAAPEKRVSWSLMALLLAVLPSLFHLQFVGRRITGDALYYYVFTRSLVRDADVDFANEYEHYKLLTRDDHSVPTATGHRRTIYSVGPGLMWTPFFLGADAVGGALRALGRPVDFSGYGPLHLNATALGSFAYGVAGLLLLYVFLRRHFSDALSAMAVLLLWWASFFPWYLSEQPLTSHPASVFLVAGFFVLRQRGALGSTAGALLLGLVVGMGMSVRWQNGVFLILPAADLLGNWGDRSARRGLALRGLGLAAGVFAGALPQVLAWKAIYGEYLLPYPPQGTDYVRLDRPYLMNLLFSSRHGLLSWTPVFSLCLAGLAHLTLRRPRPFALLWVPLIIMTYVNACVGDWWAGGSFSNRRFDSLFPIFALGLAAFLQAVRAVLRRHPGMVLAALAVAGATWNLTLVRAIQLGEAPAEAPLSLQARALASSRALSHDLGFPTTWPASWIFAARYDASPAAYDLAAGRYLFYRQNNLEGLADIGAPGDEALILDGFSAPKRDGLTTFRSVAAAARIIVSLDLPEDLDIRVTTRGQEMPARIRILVNDREAGVVTATAAWSTAVMTTPRELWRRGPNVIALISDQAIDLDALTCTGETR